MKSDKILRDLETILEKELINNPLPVVKGNSVKIKNYVIRKNKRGYCIYDIRDNSFITSTSFRRSALAIAKTLAEGTDFIDQIVQLDMKALKHLNDAAVYRNTIKNNHSVVMQQSRLARLSESLDKGCEIVEKIENFIYK
jgi:hypothetical protein